MLLRRAFLISSVTWAACLPLTPLAASQPRAASLVYGFALAVYSVGRLICHQLPARSFHLWSAALPVCARCTGIYLGAAAASVVFGLSRRLSSDARSAKEDARLILVIAAIPTAATLIFEWTTGVTPANWIRALAGIPLGVAVAWAVGMVN